jgi:hypothetical protein
MDMIDSAKLLLIMIKSIITNLLQLVITFSKLSCRYMMEQRRKLEFSIHFRFLPHTIKTKRPRYPTWVHTSDRGALPGVPLSQRPSPLSPQAPPRR